jgi:hypothetical protein
MKPNVWIQQGTVFNPNIELKRAFQKYRKFCNFKGFSIYITSGNDSDHLMESFHYSDDAMDILHNGSTLADMENIFGGNFDIVEYTWGFHIEYDPK